ncbi:hypothetical protein [Larkinella soli]|uniref:hypothetical protein n=1 Tax=Larkinella soli TaxID=1770527 RepID=UPI0019D3195F|nr:hypothetical protein [Larkinella soli]
MPRFPAPLPASILGRFFLSVALLAGPVAAYAQPPVQVKGVFPQMAVISNHTVRTEAGIGALVPWAGKLWAVGYVAHIRGSGVGLYEISDDMTMRKHPLSHTGTFANRMIHNPSNQALIGPYAIDTLGRVRLIDALKGHRLAATMQHLSRPDSLVYYLTMEGLLFETNVYSLQCRRLFDLVKELDIPASAQVHFKSAFTQGGRVVVANNSYYEDDFLGKRAAGRLAEWDGTRWTILDKNPYVEVAGKNWSAEHYGNAVYALGWDQASVLLKFFHKGTWKTYRLPKASYAYDHAWNTEWMRIRDAQTERYLMDVHGIFYELPTITYGGNILAIRPISSHLRMVPDFCYWRGLLVLAGDQVDGSTGQPQSGLWFGNVDELWQMGKPKGWGGPWWETAVRPNQPSDPYLMTGFDQKSLHLSHDALTPVTYTVEVDFMGTGRWHSYTRLTVPAKGYSHYEFPAGYSAHWVRLTVDRACKTSAVFFYN